jgi:hypothetical protein
MRPREQDCARCRALSEECEALKLKLFWRDHNVSKLQEAMRNSYMSSSVAANCHCLACAKSGRMDEDGRTPVGFECMFKPFFEGLLAELGLTFKRVVWNGGLVHEASEASVVMDVDVHLATIERSDWVHFTYGAKLWKAKTVEDPELKRLAALFERLMSATREVE